MLFRSLESELDGRLGCGRGMSSDDREPWATVTGEVYWNPTATVTTTRRRSHVPAQVSLLCFDLVSEICTRLVALHRVVDSEANSALLDRSIMVLNSRSKSSMLAEEM